MSHGPGNRDARSDSCTKQPTSVPGGPTPVPTPVPMAAQVPAGALRPATESDLPGLVALLGRANLPTDDVDAKLLDGMVVVSGSVGLLGCAAIEVLGPLGLLRSVVVREEARGGGWGAELVANRMAWASSRGLDEIYLLTTTAPRFFERLGFRAVAREHVPDPIRASREFGHLCPDSAIVMKRNVQESRERVQRPEKGDVA
jgi:amino-acid N-acetyltransferase